MDTKNNQSINAVIFDMDGTMIDTEKIKENGWKYAGECQNIIIDDKILSEMRGTNKEYCKEFINKKFKSINFEKLYNDRNEFIEKYINTNGIKMKKGLMEILQFLKSNNYKIAVASSSEEETIRRYLAKINVLDFFNVIVAGDMIENGKPNPEIYLKAVELLDIQKEKCIGIEDSNSGILSVYRAGLKPIMIPDLEQPDVKIMKEENNIMSVNKKLDVIKYDIDNIKNLIYTIRGKQVMLDSDVAMLYHYETKKINQAVKRNIERFPEKFCFQLTEEELENMWSQIVTTSKLEDNKFRSKKYLPYVFTEQGIAMLSGILKNEIAVKVSISIMDAFVEMRKFIVTNSNIFNLSTKIEHKFLEYDKKFNIVFDELQNKKESEFKEKIFFNGQIYDSYSLIIDIIKTAKNKILIIDNYIDDSILKMLSKKNKNVEVVILTSQNSNIRRLDINKFNKQYPSLKIAYTNKFHDRFIVIDNKELYHIGASLKDLGKKCFAINKMEDINFIKNVENNIK